MKGRGGGGGVVIFTPWCFMLHRCFSGALACFRYIFWNVENEPLSLLTRTPALDSRNYVGNWYMYSPHLSVWKSKQMQKGVVKTLLAKFLISIEFTWKTIIIILEFFNLHCVITVCMNLVTRLLSKPFSKLMLLFFRICHRFLTQPLHHRKTTKAIQDPLPPVNWE